MQLKKITLSSVFSFLMLFSWAQSGTKATLTYKSGEVINVTIQAPVTLVEGIKCKQEGDEKNRIISCFDLASLKTKNCEYHYITDTKDEYFARILSDGKIKFYVAEIGEIKSIKNPKIKYTTANSKLFSFVFFFQKEGKTQRINKFNFKKMVLKFMGDHREIKNKVMSKEYTFDDLAKIVELYNS